MVWGVFWGSRTPRGGSANPMLLLVTSHLRGLIKKNEGMSQRPKMKMKAFWTPIPLLFPNCTQFDALVSNLVELIPLLIFLV